MYGVSKPFSDTCYSHRNIPLRVEGCLDLARRYTVVSLLLFSLVRPASTINRQRFYQRARSEHAGHWEPFHVRACVSFS